MLRFDEHDIFESLLGVTRSPVLFRFYGVTPVFIAQ